MDVEHHRKFGTFRCNAFPDGIPEEILGNEYGLDKDHTKPYQGDNGIQFEKEEFEELHKRLPFNRSIITEDVLERQLAETLFILADKNSENIED